MANRAIPKNVSLYEIDIATLQQVGKDNGLASLSAALRYIINDWKRLKAQQQELRERPAVYHTEPTP